MRIPYFITSSMPSEATRGRKGRVYPEAAPGGKELA